MTDPGPVLDSDPGLVLDPDPNKFQFFLIIFLFNAPNDVFLL